MGIKKYKPQIDKFLAKAEKATKIAFVASAVTLLGALGYYIRNEEIVKLSPRIETQSQLENAVKREKEKLGISDYDVKVEFFNPAEHKEIMSGRSPTSYSYAEVSDKIKYQVVLVPRQQNEGTLRHELYHVRRDCLENLYLDHSNPVKKIFRVLCEEFRANLYAARGIKL